MPLPYYREVFTEHEKGEPLTLLFLQVSLELLDWITSFKRIVVHPNCPIMLHLFLDFTYNHEKKNQKLIVSSFVTQHDSRYSLLPLPSVLSCS